MGVEYNPVPQEGSDTGENDPFLSSTKRSPYPSTARWKYGVIVLSIALIGSLSANVFLLYRQIVKPWTLLNEAPSKFAGLRRNVPTVIKAHTDYDNLNRTVQDAAWEEYDLEPWSGFIALDEDYTIEQGLLHSQRWPWDSSKGVYVTASAHELHCVHVLRSSVNEAQDGVPEKERLWNYGHVMHCLNVLRDSVMCNADDTPLYIGRLHDNVHEKSPRAGTGSVKMCRDWNQLLKWSRENSACYRPVAWTKERVSEIDRYKYCPDGSRPWEKVEAEAASD